MSTIIQAESLSKWFGEVVALNNVNISIGKGVTGLLGPNGAGKSTFIKLTLGLYSPSRGTMRVFGEQPRHNAEVLRRIGYCPETDKFYDNMSGYEFVFWLNRFWGMTAKAAHTAAEEALERVRMTERMHDPIDEYSKGMRQRVKIAQALATKPDLLFLDEPMSGLDPEGREELFDLIQRLGKEGHSVVVSSHILYEIERATDNVVLLYNGLVLAHGLVREIRELIDEHPHAITVACADGRALSRHFVQDPGIMSLEYEDGKLVIRTQNPNDCYQKLNDIAATNGAGIHGITCADDNLQSVFDYLVNR